MGIYSVNCPVCKAPNLWFSGNPADQRCEACRQKDNIPNDLLKDLASQQELMGITKVSSPDLSQQLIDSLTKTIEIQAQFIEHLKAQLALLQTPQTPTSPLGVTPTPIPPYTPYAPQQPWYGPTTITNVPLGPPHIVTCGDLPTPQGEGGSSTSVNCPPTQFVEQIYKSAK
jgi:hypothetical protein